MSKIIGLMGNSGSGKSTVADYLKSKGAYVIDADEISHEVCELGQPGLAAVKARFEPYFFNDDGSLNRRRMGRVVFSDKEQLRRLEEALHPIIKERVRKELNEEKDYDLIVVDCALLVKTGLNELVDEVWLVKADADTKINRICSRDNLGYEEALNRLRNQDSDDELMRHSDIIIENIGTMEELLNQVDENL